MDVNPAGVAMLGYASREELLAVPDIAQAAYFHADDRRLFQEAIEKYGYVKDYEVTFKRKDGTPIDVSITADVRETQGEIQGYEGIIKDITARKQAQAQAERERRLVSSILEVTPVGIFMMDEGHRIIHWNRACEELTGVKRGIILGQDKAWEVFQRPEGQTLADLVLNQDYDSMWEIYGSRGLRRSPVMEDAWEAEGHFENLGGRPKEVFFSATTLKDEKGKIVGAVEAILDLTEIYELEVQLTESEQLYRTLVESSQQGITLHSGDEFVFANQAFLEMFGLKDLGGVHGDFLQMIAPEHKRPYLEWMRQLREQGEYPGVFEGKGLREGKSFDLEMDAGEVRYKGQKAILFTVRDISWRKGMEEQLIRSERLAATGKLAFDLAHEVNNPLGGILTYAHLIAEDLEPGSTPQANAEKIIKLTNRCRIIVRGLLDFARDDGPEKEAMDLNHVFQDVLSLVEGHMIMKDIRLNIELAPDLPRLYGHRTKMEQVILNMVINAAEAMEGKGDLEVSTWAEGGQVRMRFKDTGHGLSGEAARKVFEPFFTTKDRGRGTGLGLSISHGIIKQHGGKIELESSPGRGASFTLVLPTEKGSEAKK
jgi:PAS domain S-box-containing protein